MKIILTADVHLDHNPDHAYRWHTLDLVRMRLEDGRADGVIIMGDLVDAKDRHPAAFVHKVVECIRGLARAGHTWVMMGNHDYVDAGTPFFGWLDEFGNIDYIREPTKIVGGRALCIPHGATWNNNAPWRKELEGVRVVFAHETFTGCRGSNGSKLRGVALASASRKTLGVPVVSGDIHVPQAIGNVTYVGSPHPVRFGDSFEPRMLVWDTDTNEFSELPFPGIRRSVVDFCPSKEGWQASTEIRRGDHVKARYRGQQSDLPQWSEIRESIRNFIEREGGRSFGEEFHVETPAISETVLEVDDRDDEQIFADVCRSQGVDDSLAQGAAQWIDESERPEARRRPDFRPTGIAVRGFRSFIDDVAIQYPQTPGVYLLTGANGAGKSSFFQALYWVLYGRLTTGLIAKQVASWGRETETSVVLDCLIDGRVTTITRRWPPALTVEHALAEPEKVAQAEIDRLVGLDRKRFIGTVIFPQGADRFMRGRASTQLAEVVELLGLERWEARTKAARADMREAQDRKERAERMLDRAKANRDKTGKLMVAEKSKAAAFHEVLEQARAKQQHQILCQRLSDEYANTDTQFRAAQAKLDRARKVRDEWASEHEALREELADRCPTCDGPRETLSDDERDDLDTQEARASQNVRSCQRTVDRLQQRADEWAARRVTRMADYLQTRDNPDDPRVRKLADAIDDPLDIKNPHVKAAAEFDLECTQLDEEIVKLEAQVHEHAGEVDVAKHAATLYRSTQAALLESAAREFETYTNSSIPQLGLSQWEIRCRTTNDVGEFAWEIQVKAPTAPDWVDFRAWSGGERTRLCVAGEAAFADLARSRLGMRIPFEMWDEPTEYLEGEGLHDIMSFFRWRATSLEKQLWLIDHRTQHAGEVDRHWRATKTDAGTRISEA